MAIQFQPLSDQGYVLITWTGMITDQEMLNAYREYHESEQWHPKLPELSDLSGAHLEQITSEGLKQRADYLAEFLTRKHVKALKSAAYVTDDFDYGLLRIYDALTLESPEMHAVFRDFNAAKAWLDRKISNTTQVCSAALIAASWYELGAVASELPAYVHVSACF